MALHPHRSMSHCTYTCFLIRAWGRVLEVEFQVLFTETCLWIKTNHPKFLEVCLQDMHTVVQLSTEEYIICIVLIFWTPQRLGHWYKLALEKEYAPQQFLHNVILKSVRNFFIFLSRIHMRHLRQEMAGIYIQRKNHRICGKLLGQFLWTIYIHGNPLRNSLLRTSISDDHPTVSLHTNY